MIRIGRPGGAIALQEPDSSAWVCDPPHPAFDLLHAELVDAYRRNGKNFDMGRRIARLLCDAGLADVRVRATARITNAADYYQTFLLTLTSLVRDQIIAGQRQPRCALSCSSRTGSLASPRCGRQGNQSVANSAG